MNEHALQTHLLDMMRHFGDPGVFLAMFFESSIVPIPSEVIVAGAGAIGISITSIVIFGSLGSTCGAAVGYALGRYAAMPVILKVGRIIFLKPHHIEKAEAFSRKYGVWSVLIGRVLPVIPFKVFSIAAGITRIPFIPFMVCTLVGVVPRMYLLAIFGSAMVKYTRPTLIVTGAAILAFAAFRLLKHFFSGKKECNGGTGI
ncbi:MAG: DedA family protein [Candidatus Omnitrophota bacterium]